MGMKNKLRKKDADIGKANERNGILMEDMRQLANQLSILESEKNKIQQQLQETIPELQTLQGKLADAKKTIDAEQLKNADLKNTYSRLEEDHLLKTYMFDRAYQAVRENTPGLGYVFKHANKLYFEKDLKLNECLRLALGDQIELVNFKEDPEAARENMNQWVEENTNGIIKDLVPEGYVDYSTRASLVNAAYFKGQWASQFKASETKFGNFYIKRDEIRMVKFMRQKGSFNYYVSEELQAHVLELPYEGDHVRRMTPEVMKGVIAEIKTGYGKVEKLDVMLPKFSISGSLDLLEPLEKLNVSQLFGGNSNLTGFLDQYGGEKDTVSLNSAQHKSFIEVSEEGSEAAAATALLGFRSARPLFHSQFKADHPFLFLIYD